VAWLRERCRRPEEMDRPDLEPARHERALAGLARLNLWSGSAGILWPPLANLARRLRRPLRVLDLASGAGDVPVRLWRRARRAGLSLEIDGCDRSATAVAHARRGPARRCASSSTTP
jgi:SAM-dependent methyltransferase